MRVKTQVLAAVLAIMGASVSRAQPQDHVLPLPAVRQELSHAASQRATDLADIQRLLARPEAQQELAKARITPGQAQKAISVMSDQELARLAARARSADQDVQGGFIVGLLAIIGAITVIVIVLAVLA